MIKYYYVFILYVHSRYLILYEVYTFFNHSFHPNTKMLIINIISHMLFLQIFLPYANILIIKLFF